MPPPALMRSLTMISLNGGSASAWVGPEFKGWRLRVAVVRKEGAQAGPLRHPADDRERLDTSTYLLHRIVQMDRYAHGFGKPTNCVQRLVAMITRPHHYPEAVAQQTGNIVCLKAGHAKARNRRFRRILGAVDLDSRDRRQAAAKGANQRLIVLLNLINSNAIQVIARGGQAQDALDVRCSCFQTPGMGLQFAIVEAHPQNH